jgi:hypothetical protein
MLSLLFGRLREHQDAGEGDHNAENQQWQTRSISDKSYSSVDSDSVSDKVEHETPYAQGPWSDLSI